jgi:phenylpropionate dioxygenase-like ring-hydroxylating dioxygenase large terminal subunit
MPRVKQAWYVICTSDELKPGATPLERRLHGQPLAIWRTVEGIPAAVQDRCPHRGVPLSSGKVCGEHLQCCYHGWRFSTDGHCQRVPSLVGEADRQGRIVPAYTVQESQGFVWMWADSASEPTAAAPSFPYADRPGYLTVRHQLRAQASLHAVAENALDVPHTAFLHGGLFRNDKADRNRITCAIERTDAGVSCEYKGEPRPEGLVARMLSPSGGVVTHFDRFIMPCIVEVEYALGEENHIVNAAALTPVDDHETILYAVVSIRTRVPGWLIRPLVQPFALKIFDQDAKVLSKQTATMQRFGEVQYVSTEVDLLGPHILRLLQRAASEQPAPSAPYQAEVQMDV